eukprot:scaffold501353_cov41-Prasinocladus_malaysianus.AAC.1
MSLEQHIFPAAGTGEIHIKGHANTDVRVQKEKNETQKGQPLITARLLLKVRTKSSAQNICGKLRHPPYLQ